VSQPAENWEDRYRTGDTPWDKGAPHPALTDALLRQHEVSGRVLVPGSGPGHDVAALAAFPSIKQVVGIDVSPSAIAASQERLKGHLKTTLQVGDIFALPPSTKGTFDWVWEHTCFCAIDPSQRPAYVTAMADCLREGGHLLGVFYLTPWDTQEENRAAGPPFGCSEAELDRLFGGRFLTQAVWPPLNTYEGRAGREQMRLLQRL